MERRPGLREVRLLNYKSLAGVTLQLEPLTILIGPNGAGKSNILDALRLLSDAMSLQLRGAIDAHGGIEAVRRRVPGSRRPPKFGVAVHFELPSPESDRVFEMRYGFEAKAVAGHGYAITRERCYVEEGFIRRFPEGPFWFDRSTSGVTPSGPFGVQEIEEHALLLPILTAWEEFAAVRDALASIRTYTISPRAVGDLQDPTPGKDLAYDSRNIASIIQEMQRTRPDDYARLCELIGTVVPGTESVSAVRYGPKLGLRFAQRVGERILHLDAASMSDGTLRALGILPAVFQNPSPMLIGLEEPESTLHPGALGTLMDILRIGASRSQILITTHSPDILDTPDLDPKSLRLVQWQNGTTRVSPVGAASLDLLDQKLATVGELLRSNYLRPAEVQSDAEVDLFPEIEGVNPQSAAHPNR